MIEQLEQHIDRQQQEQKQRITREIEKMQADLDDNFEDINAIMAEILDQLENIKVYQMMNKQIIDDLHNEFSKNQKFLKDMIVSFKDQKITDKQINTIHYINRLLEKQSQQKVMFYLLISQMQIRFQRNEQKSNQQNMEMILQEIKNIKQKFINKMNLILKNQYQNQVELIYSNSNSELRNLLQQPEQLTSIQIQEPKLELQSILNLQEKDEILSFLVRENQLYYSSNKSVKKMNMSQKRVVNSDRQFRSKICCMNELLINSNYCSEMQSYKTSRRLLALGGCDIKPDIYIYDSDSNVVVQTLKGHQRQILRIIQSNDPQVVISMGVDRKVIFWNWVDNLVLKNIQYEHYLQEMIVSFDRNMLGIAEYDRINIYKLNYIENKYDSYDLFKQYSFLGDIQCLQFLKLNSMQIVFANNSQIKQINMEDDSEVLKIYLNNIQLNIRDLVLVESIVSFKILIIGLFTDRVIVYNEKGNQIQSLTGLDMGFNCTKTRAIMNRDQLELYVIKGQDIRQFQFYQNCSTEIYQFRLQIQLNSC